MFKYSSRKRMFRYIFKYDIYSEKILVKFIYIFRKAEWQCIIKIQENYVDGRAKNKQPYRILSERIIQNRKQTTESQFKLFKEKYPLIDNRDGSKIKVFVIKKYQQKIKS